MLISFAARYSPRANEIAIDGAVLGFTIGLAIIVAILLSFAPRLSGENSLSASLAAGGRGRTGGVRRQRLQSGLVVAQVAVSVILLTGAGLLTRTMQRLSLVETGMDNSNVLTMEVPSDFSSPDRVGAIAKYENMKRQLAALPGVKEVALGSVVPLRSSGFLLEVKAEDRPQEPGRPIPQSEYRSVSPSYFRTAGIPVLKGREFNAADGGGPRVVILNQTAADLLFGDKDPVGRRVAWTGDVLKFIGVSDEWRTVVGVVGDTRDGGLDAASLPAMFLPFEQADFPTGAFLIRTQGEPTQVVSAATRIVRGVDPRQPIERVLTVDQIRDESVGPRRLNAQLVASFGILALIVAAIGIAAVLAFSVSARTNEIGIRMSLGADAGKVQRMFISEGGVLVLSGLVIGIVGAVAFSKLIQGLLFGVEPTDPVTLIAVFGIMAAVGLVACWIPAMRAARVDPGIALRAQ